jgi:beta-N-acetylhexosaminidase
MTNPPLHEFGRHFVVGLQPSPELTDHDRFLLDRLRPAGVVVFAGNFAAGEDYAVWLDRYRSLLHDVRECIQRPRILVCIDHEGGRVIRPPAPITRFDYARRWGARAEEVGSAMATELRSLGVNLDFAPVLDVDTNPDNPVIGPRAFGRTPEVVAAAGTAFIAGLQGGGVLGCAKHFPGHGDTSVDSHYALPVVDCTAAELRARELRPFAAAVAAGVRTVMIGHILVPSIDEVNPATLSQAMIGGVLRGELGFTGVVVTDDVGMGAISELFRDAGNAARVLLAGGDIITVCAEWTGTDRAVELASAIARQAADGSLPEAVLAASRQRIDALLEDAPQHEVSMLDPAVFAEHARLATTAIAADPRDEHA